MPAAINHSLLRAPDILMRAHALRTPPELSFSARGHLSAARSAPRAAPRRVGAAAVARPLQARAAAALSSLLLALSSTAGGGGEATAAEPPVFVGEYDDPSHPGCERRIERAGPCRGSRRRCGLAVYGADPVPIAPGAKVYHRSRVA